MWEILRFLWTCPNKGAYNRYRMERIGEIQKNIIEAIAVGQYIIIRNGAGSIEHFLSYWRVDAEGLDSIDEGVIPDIRCKGDKLFICEHGNKGGRHSLTKMIGEIKRVATGNKGVSWRNSNRGTFKAFLDKKGAPLCGEQS